MKSKADMGIFRSRSEVKKAERMNGISWRGSQHAPSQDLLGRTPWSWTLTAYRKEMGLGGMYRDKQKRLLKARRLDHHISTLTLLITCRLHTFI